MRPVILANWLDHFERGHFSTEVLSIKIAAPQGEFSGQGFLRWRVGRGTTIKALTEGGEILDRMAFSGEQSPLGRLIPSSDYASLDAETRDNHTLQIERIWPHCYSIQSGHPTVVWSIGPREIHSGITLRRESKEADETSTEMLLTNARRMIWPRMDATLRRCLEFQTSYGKVLGWKKNNLARLLIRHRELCDWNAIANGLIMAFRFWTSCMVSPVVSEYRHGFTITRRVAPLPSRSGTPLAPPLGHLLYPALNAYHEPLLSKCVEFFADEKNSDVATLVSAFLASGNLPFSAQALVTAVCVEGLAKRIAAKRPQESSLSIEQREAVETALSQSSLPENLVKRFNIFMDRMNEPNGANIVATWCKYGFLGFQREDGIAFSSLRNRTAHGKLNLFGNDDVQKQSSLESRNRLYNMLNKIVFGLIGYEGPYFDYSTWSVQTMPTLQPKD